MNPCQSKLALIYRYNLVAIGRFFRIDINRYKVVKLFEKTSIQTCSNWRKLVKMGKSWSGLFQYFTCVQISGIFVGIIRIVRTILIQDKECRG